MREICKCMQLCDKEFTFKVHSACLHKKIVFRFLAATSDVMVVQLKSIELNILILQTVVDDGETCLTFTSLSTIASSLREYHFKAGFTDSNLSLSLTSFSNLFSTNKFDLSNFSPIRLFQFQSSFKNPTKIAIKVA